MESAKGWLNKHGSFWGAFLMIAISIASPIATLAQNFPKPPTGNAPASPITDTISLIDFICSIMDWIFWGLVVLSVIMALVAAYRYVTSAGDPEKTGKAGKTLLYAAIAIAVALLAFGVPRIVASFLGAGGPVTGC